MANKQVTNHHNQDPTRLDARGDELVPWAERYVAEGISLVALNANKEVINRAPCRQKWGWSHLMENKAPLSEVLNWLDYPGIAMFGQVNGPVSGMRAIRDFDHPDSYELWIRGDLTRAERFPVARNRESGNTHVHFVSTIATIPSPKSGNCVGFLPLDDGELRLSRCQNQLPGGGSKYDWVIAPWEVEPPVVDPVREELARAYVKNSSSQVGVAQEVVRAGGGVLRHQEAEGFFGALPYVPDDPGPAGDIQLRDGRAAIRIECASAAAVDRALLRTIPTRLGARRGKLFELVRELKALFGPDCPPLALEPIVRRWHAVARPNIRTTSWRATWRDFLELWDYVRHPSGRFMAAALAAIKRKALPWDVRILCRELQATVGDRDFFLSCRKIEEVTEGAIHNRTALRRLRKLVEIGDLREVATGRYCPSLGSRASVYRYLGSDLVIPQ